MPGARQPAPEPAPRDQGRRIERGVRGGGGGLDGTGQGGADLGWSGPDRRPRDRAAAAMRRRARACPRVGAGCGRWVAGGVEEVGGERGVKRETGAVGRGENEGGTVGVGGRGRGCARHDEESGWKESGLACSRGRTRRVPCRVAVERLPPCAFLTHTHAHILRIAFLKLFPNICI